MRPAAKVHERAAGVNGNLRLLFQRIAVLIFLTGFQSFNQLQFERLVFEELLGLVSRDHLAFKTFFALDDAAHTLLDGFQVIGGQWARQVKVVVKTIINGRTNGHFAIGEFFQHGLGHHMRGGVPYAVKLRLFVFAFLICHFYSFHK